MKNEMIKRYLELYEDMETSAMPEKMKGFGKAEMWAFKRVAEEKPDVAQMWLDRLEAMSWHNYLSRVEAMGIASALINQDGSKGAHWDFDVFRAAVESLEGEMVASPYYNCYALWVTANMLYSDHYNSAKEFVAKEDMPKFFYLMAVEKLKDVDRPRFIREYYGLM